MSSPWSYESLRKLMEEFSPTLDPADPKERKRLRILTAAGELIARHGYRRTSVEDIAKHAGVAKGTVYLYFKTKADLLVQAIVEEKKRILGQILPSLEEDRPARERLRMWLRVTFSAWSEMPLLSKLLGGDREIYLVLEEMDAKVRDRSDEMQQAFLKEMLDQAARPHRWTPEELADRARLLMNLIMSLAADPRARDGLSDERFASILADVVVDGLCPAPAERSER